MILKNTKQCLSVVLSFVFASARALNGYQAVAPAPAAGSGNPAEATSQSASDLQALVAPIALYPDSLVAQILTAATFPDQVAVADYWVQQNKWSEPLN